MFSVCCSVSQMNDDRKAALASPHSSDSRTNVQIVAVKMWKQLSRRVNSASTLVRAFCAPIHDVASTSTDVWAAPSAGPSLVKVVRAPAVKECEVRPTKTLFDIDRLIEEFDDVHAVRIESAGNGRNALKSLKIVYWQSTEVDGAISPCPIHPLQTTSSPTSATARSCSAPTRRRCCASSTRC